MHFKQISWDNEKIHVEMRHFSYHACFGSTYYNLKHLK